MRSRYAGGVALIMADDWRLRRSDPRRWLGVSVAGIALRFAGASGRVRIVLRSRP